MYIRTYHHYNHLVTSTYASYLPSPSPCTHQIKAIIKSGIESPGNDNDLKRQQLLQLAQLNGTMKPMDILQRCVCMRVCMQDLKGHESKGEISVSTTLLASSAGPSTSPTGGVTTTLSNRRSSPSSPTPSSVASAVGLDTWSQTACSAGKTQSLATPHIVRMYICTRMYVHHTVSCHLIPIACRTNPPPPPASEPSLVDRAKMDSEVGTQSDFGQYLQASICFRYPSAQSIYVYL